jgi:type III restriction enzyme
MMQLKDYQLRVLDSLKQFFQLCSKGLQPNVAFQQVVEKNGTQYYPYVNVPGLAAVPYICLRVPTGGGKTLLGSYAAGYAKDYWVQAERAVVLWLVPTTTILDQTANALRNPRHPYRQALEQACGPVEVLTIDEALSVSRAAVDGQTVVIVSTIQSFRVEDTASRKVYSQNGAMPQHLENIPPALLADLEIGPDSKPIPSLVNMLRLRHPVVIVDEAHNARTELSSAALAAVRPSCIIEFTATPEQDQRGGKFPSNVLHRVSAYQLKAEEMIKLPIRVLTQTRGQEDQLLAEAVAALDSLDKLAHLEGQQTGEYIRPIMLIQANRQADCEPLRQKILEKFPKITKDQIKISIGGHDELEKIANISDPSCPVRFIITVQKLTEGWDCPFAYVLCSLRQTKSSTAIEQIVGRILRLPGAKTKRNADLNCAYVFSLSPSLPEVLNELVEALVSNGFTNAEAQRVIAPGMQGMSPLGTTPQTVTFGPGAITPEAAQQHMVDMIGKVVIDAISGNVTINVPLSPQEVASLAAGVTAADALPKLEHLNALVTQTTQAFGIPAAPTPSQQGREFKVPLLSVNEGGSISLFDRTILLDRPWRLSQKDASLSLSYDPTKRPVGQAGVVDLEPTNQVVSHAVHDGNADYVTMLRGHVGTLQSTTDWSVDDLIAWLDKNIDHQDIPLEESAAFMRKVVTGLMASFGIADINVLAIDRYPLRDQVEERIDQHRQDELKQAYQQVLDSSLLVIDPKFTIDFKNTPYAPSWLFDGSHQFNKHYYPPKPGELRHMTTGNDLTEEFKCAFKIDTTYEIEYWVRNLSGKPGSFRLQTPSDWFYPDFVCKLKDGRILVVEYKGAHLYDGPDAQEKRAIGAVWESRSNGQCLFIMPYPNRLEEIDQKIRR